jgi:hypothetical protein
MPHPVALVAIPGAVAIIVAPIRADRERDDGQADGGAVVEERHRVALIRIAQVATVHPAAQAGQADIAPAVARDAAHYRERHATRHLRDDGIVARWPCVEIHGHARNGLTLGECRRRGGKGAGETGKHCTGKLLAHRGSSWIVDGSKIVALSVITVAEPTFGAAPLRAQSRLDAVTGIYRRLSRFSR